MIQVRRQDEWAVGDMVYITAAHAQSPYQPGDIVRTLAISPEGFPVAGSSRVFLHAPKLSPARALRILTVDELEHLPSGSVVELIRDLGPDRMKGDRITAKRATRLRATLTYALVSRPGVITLTGKTHTGRPWSTVAGRASVPMVEVEGMVLSRENLLQMQHALDRVQLDMERQTHLHG